MCDAEKISGSPICNFKIALRMRDFEITQLAQRNNFVMVFQGVLFAGVIQSDHSHPVVSFLVCVAGLLASIFQVGMACGAKFWQEYWEQMLSNYEAEIRSEKPELFHDDNWRCKKTVHDRMGKRGIGDIAGSLVMCQFSVSRIPIYVGIALAIVWALLVLCTLRGYPPLSIPRCIVGFP